MSVEETELELNEQIKQRFDKLKELRKLGNPYPNDFRRNAYAQDILNKHQDKSKVQLEQDKISVMIAGRIMMRRIMGKASFIQIQDMTGRLQLYIRKEDLKSDLITSEDLYNNFKSWDIGDIIGATGELFKTNTGELSVKVSDIRLLTKALLPLPDKWHGLSDQETKYRKRYVDLIVNQNTRNTFKIRSKVISFIRDYFINLDYMEVETPMMHPIPGGAAAKPFITHHNALDMELYLRIAPELYLKKLVVGGLERVFEINRNFRNEGLSTKHNPEFTMIEFYQAYTDYKDLINLTEDLFKKLINHIVGSHKIVYQGTEIDFSGDFAKYTITESIISYNTELNMQDLLDSEKLKNILDLKNISYEQSWGLGRLQLELFEETVESKLINPTFITEYPAEVSPLARRNDKNPEITDRFEFFIMGNEIANAFSELNDPIDQKQRFMEQVNQKDAGDEEAMHFDADYIHALEYGLPPTAGEGIGIDRLVMLLTDSASIKDVLLFPLMRPVKD